MPQKVEIILASGSPRRRELLEREGVSFTVLSADVDESLEPDLLRQPEEAAKKLAERKAGAIVLTRHSKEVPTILIGKDTRVSGDMLEAALIAGICSSGANAVRVGVVPTPAVAYLTRKHKAEAGVVISASHNSMEYNGIKFY